MPHHSPAASAVLASVVLDAAPLIASALAHLDHPGTVRFAFTDHSVIASSSTADGLDIAFPHLRAAFGAAGWGFSTSCGTDGARIRISFHPPWTLTRCGQPPAFPPR